MLECYEINKIADKYIENYLNNKDKYNYWDWGNDVLYKMCEEKPHHDEENVIYAKIWIIGRSYAAPIERRAANREISNDEFYKKFVVEEIKKAGKQIDTQIDELNKLHAIDEESIKKTLLLHKTLTDIFRNLTNHKKRSLASKYLHFHCPNMFFIYDSIANSEITKLVEKVKKNSSIDKEFDTEYANFYYMALALMNYIKKKYPEENVTPRDIDNILYIQKSWINQDKE